MTYTTCPGSEELARLIDGGLVPDQRRDLLAHVASCRTCLEVIGGSIHTLESAELTSAARPVRAWRRRALYAAAMLLVAAGIATIVLRPWRLSRDQLAALPSAGRLATEFPRTRGGSAPMPWLFAGTSPSYGFAFGEMQSTVEFRIGVRLFDFDTAIRTSDREGANGTLADLVALLSERGASDELVGRYRAFEQRIAGGSLGAVEAALADAESRLVGRLPSPYVALGWWCEAGRMFTAVGMARSEWPEEARLLLGMVREREVPPGVVTSLREIAETPKHRYGPDETRRRWTVAFTRILQLM